MKRIIFGDTGGHSSQLLAALVELGLNTANFTLPEDLTVVHVGDLIHRGPNSEDILRIVDKIMRRNPGRWIQLLGNHESQHIPGAPGFWRCSCTPEMIEMILEWRATGRAKIATALAPSEEFILFGAEQQDILVTHAGITSQFWQNVIGTAPDAATAADRMNLLPFKAVSRPGVMLAGPKPPAWLPEIQKAPGPLWALASGEVYPSWFYSTMPFVQVHGHTSAWDWGRKRWYPGTPPAYIAATTLDVTTRVSYTEVGQSLLVGVDPAFSQYANVKKQPYLTL